MIKMENSIQIGDFKVVRDFDCISLPEKKTIINTINAYSWTVTSKNPVFKEALQKSDILLPDGVSIVWAAKFLTKEKIKKVAGADLHNKLLALLNKVGGSCFYLGSTQNTLNLLEAKVKKEYPNITVKTYSPPYKKVFSEEDNQAMYAAINSFSPDVVFVGMTAPKQEIWIHENVQFIHTKIICGIGAVFDFYAETKKRPPRWMIHCGLEWLGRLIAEPKRLWKRYLVYNAVFIYEILQVYFRARFNPQDIKP